MSLVWILVFQKYLKICSLDIIASINCLELPILATTINRIKSFHLHYLCLNKLKKKIGIFGVLFSYHGNTLKLFICS